MKFLIVTAFTGLILAAAAALLGLRVLPDWMLLDEGVSASSASAMLQPGQEVTSLRSANASPDGHSALIDLEVGSVENDFAEKVFGATSPGNQDFSRQRRFRNRWDPRFDETGRRGVPDWKVNSRFKYDEFRFVRVKYRSYGRTRWGQKWRIDYPDSDLNFSFRLQQLTSLKVNPDPIALELTDERIFNYPFLYLIEPGDIALSIAEAKAMRHYLDNGGFVMVDDFWGEWEWQDFQNAMSMVYPNRSYQELDLDHPVFHCVYDLKKKPQCPAIGNYEQTGETTDRPWDPTARDVHYRAWFDDNDRMCVIACFNTDLGDGWEREGESEFYFKRFSEKEAYPMGINIVVYAMTH